MFEKKIRFVEFANMIDDLINKKISPQLTKFKVRTLKIKFSPYVKVFGPAVDFEGTNVLTKIDSTDFRQLLTIRQPIPIKGEHVEITFQQKTFKYRCGYVKREGDIIQFGWGHESITIMHENMGETILSKG